jgi:hypothetical protein
VRGGGRISRTELRLRSCKQVLRTVGGSKKTEEEEWTFFSGVHMSNLEGLLLWVSSQGVCARLLKPFSVTFQICREEKRSKIFHPKISFKLTHKRKGRSPKVPSQGKTNGHKKYKPLVCMNSAGCSRRRGVEPRVERGAEPEPLKMQISKLLFGMLF